MPGNHIIDANIDFFGDMIFDSRELPESRKTVALFKNIIDQTIRVYSYTVAKTALCVPVGQTSFYPNKNFIFIISRPDENNFLMTVRGNQAALSFEAGVETIEDDHNLYATAIKGFLGTISDFSQMLHSMSLSIGNKNPGHDFSKKFQTPCADAPFLGIAGDEASPERAYFKHRQESGSPLWAVRPLINAEPR